MTLEYNRTDIFNLFKSIGEDLATFRDTFEFDASDAISAECVIAQLSTVPSKATVIIDYLPLLDQKRENPELMVQMRALKSFTHERGLMMVFLSQIDRSFDPSAGVCPGLNDVRLPNPLDLTLFNKACFLNNGELKVSAIG